MIAGYRLEGVLGQGGMGVVYEARQLSLDRPVALKVLIPELSADPAFRERFKREGLIQARIDHPSIVAVHEAGDHEGALWLAMRLVRGTTLKDQIAPAGMDPARALRLLRQVSDALDAAHEAGLVHRDIKPQNILVGSRDHAFLADFGLTRTGDRGSGLTRTGQRMGTPDYMAPEQIRGDTPAPPADHYAVAAVLYECLTGDVPFPMATDTAVFWAHMADPPPLVSARRPDLPRRLDDVLQRGLAKHPAERYPTAVALVDAASSALGAPTELGIAAPVQRRSRTTQRGVPAALPTELRTAP
jgi:serine/threonine protein kinase